MLDSYDSVGGSDEDVMQESEQTQTTSAKRINRGSGYKNTPPI